MQITSIGSASPRAQGRPRTLIVRDSAVWLWPGVPLTTRRGNAVIPLPAETSLFWITKFHGPEAIETPILGFLERAARYLGQGDDVAAQRALDRSRLDRLSPEGAMLMKVVAGRLQIAAPILPVKERNPLWDRHYVERLSGLFDRFASTAIGLAKIDAGVWDEAKHPRWPAGTPNSVGGEFRPSDGSAGSNDTDVSDRPLGAGHDPNRSAFHARLRNLPLLSPVVDFSDGFHDVVVAHLADYFRSIGIPVVLKPAIRIIGSNRSVVGYPDMIIHEPNKPIVVFEVKTGIGPTLSWWQARYIPLLQLGGHIYSTNPGIAALGLVPGVPFPPVLVCTVWTKGPGEPYHYEVLPGPEFVP